MVRTLFSAVGLVLCALLLAENAHAQEIEPHSYLFVEVANASGQRVGDATVRVSGPDGKEILNLKTSKNGTVDSSFPRRQAFHHYDLQITKPGYLVYESVLFPSVLSNRRLDRLTDEIPNTIRPSNYSSGSPVKVTLTPATPAELRTAELEAKKRQLLLAAKRGDALSLKKILQQGVDADSADAKGVPAVAWATFAGDPETIRLLLDAGVNVRNKAPNSLLIYLAEGAFRGRPQTEIIDKLIAAGADVNASNPYQGTVVNKAIIQAPHSLPFEAIKALIKAGVDVNAPDAIGYTPLMLAARPNQEELVELLLSAGAKRSLHAKDRDGRSALIFAAGAYRDSTLAIVKLLLANGATVNEADEAGETPLMLAARGGSIETVQTLLKAGAAINAKDRKGQTALVYATREIYTTNRIGSQIVKLLLAAGARINEVDASGRSALIHALEGYFDPELVNVMLANGANVNLIDAEGQTALMFATQRYSYSPGIVEKLLQAGATSTINAKDKKGATALLYAVTNGALEIVPTLIAAGASVNNVNEKGETALILAVQRNSLALIKLLLAAHASIDIKDKQGNTALMYARSAEWGPETSEIFNALLAHAASLNTANKFGETPLIVAAAQKNNLKALHQLLNSDAKASLKARTEYGATALAYAAAFSDKENVAALLAAGANANDADNAGQTILMRAVSRYDSSLDLVRLLLKAGANVNAADANGRTVLHHLAQYFYDGSKTVIFDELIAAGANVNAADAVGQTILMSLVQRESPAFIQMALKAGATINAKDRNGRTALFYAFPEQFSVKAEVVRALIAAGANVNDADHDGQTSLMLAIQQGSLEAINMLLAAGAAINATDKNGQSALMFAAHTGNVKTVETLLKSGASVKVKDSHGKSALLHAADEAHIPSADIVQRLIAAGANVNERDERRQTPLMLAALRGSLETVTVLLKAGAAVNDKDETGLTPLMFAAWGASDSTPDIFKILIKAKARINDVNKVGKSALMFAAQHGSGVLLQLLLAAHASINARNNEGESPLIFAIKNFRSDEQKIENVKLLLRSGADVNIKNREGHTPIELARQLGQAAIVKLIEDSQSRH